MKVYQVIYVAKGFERVSIVVARNGERAEKIVAKNFDSKDHYKLDRIHECKLEVENIIHTEVIEIV